MNGIISHYSRMPSFEIITSSHLDVGEMFPVHLIRISDSLLSDVG